MWTYSKQVQKLLTGKAFKKDLKMNCVRLITTAVCVYGRGDADGGV